MNERRGNEGKKYFEHFLLSVRLSKAKEKKMNEALKLVESLPYTKTIITRK